MWYFGKLKQFHAVRPMIVDLIIYWEINEFKLYILLFIGFEGIDSSWQYYIQGEARFDENSISIKAYEQWYVYQGFVKVTSVTSK